MWVVWNVFSRATAIQCEWPRNIIIGYHEIIYIYKLELFSPLIKIYFQWLFIQIKIKGWHLLSGNPTIICPKLFFKVRRKEDFEELCIPSMMLGSKANSHRSHEMGKQWGPKSWFCWIPDTCTGTLSLRPHSWLRRCLSTRLCTDIQSNVSDIMSAFVTALTVRLAAWDIFVIIRFRGSHNLPCVVSVWKPVMRSSVEVACVKHGNGMQISSFSFRYRLAVEEELTWLFLNVSILCDTEAWLATMQEMQQPDVINTRCSYLMVSDYVRRRYLYSTQSRKSYIDRNLRVQIIIV